MDGEPRAGSVFLPSALMGLTRLPFKSHQKITTTKDYQRVFDTGQRRYNANFRIHFLMNENTNAKIGVIISRKIRGSVKRNRYKRLIREFFRLLYPQIKPGTWLVVILTKTIEPNFQEVQRSLVDILKKTEVLRNESV